MRGRATAGDDDEAQFPAIHRALALRRARMARESGGDGREASTPAPPSAAPAGGDSSRGGRIASERAEMLRLERAAEREWLAFTRQAAAFPDPGTIVRDGGRRMREQLDALRKQMPKSSVCPSVRREPSSRGRAPRRGRGSRARADAAPASRPRSQPQERGADEELTLDIGGAGPEVKPFAVKVATEVAADANDARPSPGPDAASVARAERRLLAAGMMGLAAHLRTAQRARARLRARVESSAGADPRRLFGLSVAALQSIAAERGKYAKAAAWCARRRVAVVWAAWTRMAAGRELQGEG